MSTEPQTTAQLEPRVVVCEAHAYKFLQELERLITQGYRINFGEMFVLIQNCQFATLELPSA